MVLLALAAPAAIAADLPMKAAAVHWEAAAGNASEAFIVVSVSNADGSPKTNAQIPAPAGNAGVELKNSKWGFQTLLVPPAFKGMGVQVVQPQTYFAPQQTRPVELPGQLRILQVIPATPAGSGADSRAGLYWMRILPMYGFQGGQKQLLRWVSGEYLFRVSYRDGNDQGSALGVLTIR